MNNRIEVRIDWGDKEVAVGTLVSDQRTVYFRFYEAFLDRGVDLSPFYLDRTTAIQRPNTNVFDGLHGVFADSLPDGWGRLLLDRALVTRGTKLEDINILDRLAYVGTAGMGALTYHPVSVQERDTRNLDLDTLEREAKEVLKGHETEVLETLLQYGGSSGGARPKVLAGFNSQDERLILGQENLPDGYQPWLIKFTAAIDPNEMARMEYAYHHMALAAGLEMAPCRLFPGPSGKVYFGTQRFDRTAGGRLHLHSAAGLMHDNFRLSSMDYGHLMDAAFRLESDVSAYRKVLRLAAFNVFAHNRDDHSKNVSFLLDKHGQWRLAPAYDLTFSHSSHGEHSMTVAGEGKNPERRQLLELSRVFSIRKPEEILEEVREAISRWPIFARESGLTKSATSRIQRILNP